MASASSFGPAFTLLGTIVALFASLLTYVYDRGRRYNYLADRWNTIMALNIDVPDFFDPQKTRAYTEFELAQIVRYRQHARRYWGFVEDVIRNNYWFEPYLEKAGIDTFLTSYDDTIRECIIMHSRWLTDNKQLLFTYAKFRQILTAQFSDELKQVGLVLVELETPQAPRKAS
jgi:hypothetical protein